MDIDTFEINDSNINLTYPKCVSEIRTGHIVLIKNFPCKVVDIKVSKTGKHGHAKAHLFGINIFTNKKYEDIFQMSHNIDVPYVVISNYILTDITDDLYAILLNEESGLIREDLVIDDNMAREFHKHEGDKDVRVLVTKAMGHEQIMSIIG